MNTSTPHNDVFISSKSEDYPSAEEVYDFLEANGIYCFLASRELDKIGEAHRAGVDDATSAVESANAKFGESEQRPAPSIIDSGRSLESFDRIVSAFAAKEVHYSLMRF